MAELTTISQRGRRRARRALAGAGWGSWSRCCRAPVPGVDAGWPARADPRDQRVRSREGPRHPRDPAEEIDLIPISLPVEEIFYRHIIHREWDVATSFAKSCSWSRRADPVVDRDTGLPFPGFPAFVHLRSTGRAGAPASDLAGRRAWAFPNGRRPRPFTAEGS